MYRKKMNRKSDEAVTDNCTNFTSIDCNDEPEIEIVDVKPSRTISEDDRRKLQRVLEVINKHLPDKMLTQNPFKKNRQYARTQAAATDRNEEINVLEKAV